jgi:hypothetical protein
MSSVGLALGETVNPDTNFVQTSAHSLPPTDLGTALPIRENLEGPRIAGPQDTVTLSERTFPPSKDPGNPLATQIPGSGGSGSNGDTFLTQVTAHAGDHAASTRKSTSPTSLRAPHPSAQESLQELDLSLQRIGIDPQRVSLIRRAEALNLADDPLALEQYFQASVTSVAESNQPAAPSTLQTISSEPSGSVGPVAASNTQEFAPSEGHHLNISG